MDFMKEIVAERQRQINEEGWTPEHDDQHDGGEMLRAAVAYLWHDTEDFRDMSGFWPWDAIWWKPKDRRRNLIRAGALCLAEKERIERGNFEFGTRSTGHVDNKLGFVLSEFAALVEGDG